MNVLVTGGAGVIGRILVRLLVAGGHQVTSVDRQRPQFEHPNVTNWILDLREFEFARTHFDVILHLAASFERTEESPEYVAKCIDDNIEATTHLAKQVLRQSRGDRPSCLVFASSYLVYDACLYFSRTKAKIKEGSWLRPRNLCGAVKLMSEELLSRLPIESVVSARIFRVYGGGGNEVISRWVRAALKNEIISLYDGLGEFDYIHAEDVARSLVHLASLKMPGVFNVGSGCAESIGDIAYFIGSKTGAVVINGGTGRSVERSEANISRIVETGWEPRISIFAGLERTINEERERLHV